MRRGRTLLLLTAVGLVVAMLVSKPQPQDHPQTRPESAERTVIDAAMAQISAHSRGTVREPRVEAAPRGPETPAGGDTPFPDAPVQPPDGYSFVVSHGDMSKARMEREDEAEYERADHDWLGTPEAFDRLVSQAAAAGRDWSFGWLRRAPGASLDDLRQALNRLNVEVLGSAGDLVRARLPGDPTRLHTVSELPSVDGLGALPTERKIAAGLANDALTRPGDEELPVFITLMTDDPGGQWRRALEGLGAVVGRFDSDIRVYTANVSYDTLAALAEADFVLAVEPVGLVEAAHDTAVPAMGADALRLYQPSSRLFSGIGGASVPIGVMDTGLNINHVDIASNRESICGANFVYFEPRIDALDLWVDADGHGTHVTGTIAGNGSADPRFAGMAPLVSHIRFAKVLSHEGRGLADSVIRGMDFLARPTGCPEAGWSAAQVKPLIVNMSLAASALIFEGRGVDQRKLDSIVWGHRQLYVVAQSNENIHGFSNFAAAKNSLAVGAVLDSGELVFFSSHGPTADGRLAPQVVATGVDLHSARGGGSRGAYVSLSGTSMASPSVAGVAALLMDAAPAHREQPALTRARLMASAIKPDPWLEDPIRFPADNSNGPGALQARYGLGKASARTSVLNRDRGDGWTSGGAISELQDGEYAYHDIVVPAGASRLDLVMTWDEPPTDTIASAVLNDLDLWLDRDGDCGAGACGEYSSISRTDNVEWVIVRNPPAGTYRAKVVSQRVYTAAPRAALAWTVIRGASTPKLNIDADKAVLHSGDELTLTLTADAYVAAGTRLAADCRDASGSPNCHIAIRDAQATREDGLVYGKEWSDLGSAIALGEIAVGESQEVTLRVANRGEEAARLYFTASAWNARAASMSVVVRTRGADQSEIPEAEPPTNAAFAGAATLEGEEGSRMLDLLLAPPEVGEPVFGPSQGRPSGSAWYVWTAPTDRLARFGASRDSDFRDASEVNITVFQGDRITALKRVASGPWGVEFFAEAGQTYRVRVSHNGRSVPLILRWSQGPRPANDAFAASVALTGAEGGVEGNNEGATLEPGELFGQLAATIWYRWTAPSDGAWEFASSNENLHVLAFVGDSLSELRLVSGLPRASATFPAGSGQEYRIAVAASNAYAAGGAFELTWKTTERGAANDDLQGAEEIESTLSSSHFVKADAQATVEPNEPTESGIRTGWWVWTAPQDGRYTWRLTETDFTELLVSVFTGDTLGALRLVATTGPDTTATEFTFAAVRGRRYWISVGFQNGDLGAFLFGPATATLVWGPTPSNDALTGAVSLTDASGSVTGSSVFATAERGERGGVLGHSSLWWTFAAPAAGWYRFWIDEPDASWTLAVYRDAGDGFGSLELIGTSQFAGIPSDAGAVVFQAEAGVRYTIRLGLTGDATGDEFILRWGEAEPPVWLRYAGRLDDGAPDANGNPVALPDPGDVAFNSTGTALYVGTALGLRVFERNPATGDLALVQSLGGDFSDSSLIWNPRRQELYAHDCGTWRRFAPVDGTHPALRDAGTLTITGPAQSATPCGDVLMDSGGSFFYVFGRWGGALQVLAFNFPLFSSIPGDSLRPVQTVEIDDDIMSALISNSGSHVYVLTGHALLVFTRHPGSGELTQVWTAGGLQEARAIAISDDDRHLFVFDVSGNRTILFQLDDPSNPQFLDILPPFGNAPQPEGTGCQVAAARNGLPAVDAFCTSSAFSVQWRLETGELEATDYVAHWQQDRFNNHLPDFGFVRGMAASPDGMHAYLTTDDAGIVVFERVGNETVERE